MTAVTAIYEQYAAEKSRLAAVRDMAAARLAAHERATAARASQLAEFEADYAANATAEALGQEPTRALPDAAALEKLRADAIVAEPVRRQLAAHLNSCETAVQAAESNHRAAVAEHLVEVAVTPALNELQVAFDAIRKAAVNVMAAHNLAYRKFNDRAPLPSCYDDLHGPVAHLLTAMRGLPFETYPYGVRPAWLAQHGQFLPGDLPGVAERTAELLAEVDQVPA